MFSDDSVSMVGPSLKAGRAGMLWCGLLSGWLLLALGVRAEEPAAPEAIQLWQFSFFADNKYRISQTAAAVAADGTIYVGSTDGRLYALRADGREKWRFKAGGETKSSPAIADEGTIYFGSRDRFFYAVTPEGALKWRYATGAWVDATPAIAADGTIYFGGWDKVFYALRPDGTLKWKYPVGAIVESSPAIAADGTIYFGAHDRKFYALNPDGTVRWTFGTGGAIIAASAIGANGTIYFRSLDGNLYALNPDGSEQWRHHTESTSEGSPIIDEAGNIIVGLNDRVQVLTPAGKPTWHQGAGVPVDVTGLAVAGRFYFPVPWRSVMALEPVDHVLWRAGLEFNPTGSLVMDNQGVIYVSAGRYLYAIRPPGEPLPLAKSSWPMFQANARHTGRVAP